MTRLERGGMSPPKVDADSLVKARTAIASIHPAYWMDDTQPEAIARERFASGFFPKLNAGEPAHRRFLRVIGYGSRSIEGFSGWQNVSESDVIGALIRSPNALNYVIHMNVLLDAVRDSSGLEKATQYQTAVTEFGRNAYGEEQWEIAHPFLGPIPSPAPTSPAQE